ncbi:hypothetical protein LJB95_02055 [Paludibacteraceae bacterium OttesenSCG-928-F17]|nr:hypothetical protein [Paludibacteraceae bacterium OttesenSCG-928-F17]
MKIKYSFVIILILSFFIVSCNNDDEEFPAVGYSHVSEIPFFAGGVYEGTWTNRDTVDGKVLRVKFWNNNTLNNIGWVETRYADVKTGASVEAYMSRYIYNDTHLNLYQNKYTQYEFSMTEGYVWHDAGENPYFGAKPAYSFKAGLKEISDTLIVNGIIFRR